MKYGSEVVHLAVGLMLIGLSRGNPMCVFSRKASVKLSNPDHSYAEMEEDAGSFTGKLLNSNTTELCPKTSSYCYALWKEETVPPSSGTNISTKIVTLLAQGCWDNSEDCSVDSCISTKPPSKALNNTKYCCCLGDLCNANVTDAYVPTGEDIADSQPALQYVEQASYQVEVVIILATVCSFVILAVAGILIFRLCSSGHKPSLDSIHLEAALAPLPHFDLDSLKLQEVVGRGRFGSVSKGTLNDQTVAVKVFVMQHKQYFINERDIYALPHMEHPSIPKYIGSEERLSSDGRPEYLLVLSYAPLGCMQDFLRQNTVDWPTLCKMAQTLTHGLAHLHTEFKKGDKYRQCIAHRDLNSRNILVKSDGSCELCDFGYAIRISGSKYYQNGEEQVAETTSLADVGTLRYMAPEVLEGAVNLRDCESSLKQIDIYALGLVLWEIGTRCSDLYQGAEVPEYRLPFEAEIGLHPTMEQMQVLVTRNKARPLFPDIWKASNPAVRTYKETIEDCWDQDAEARLTALCVEERLMELPLLWERHKAGNSVPGVSPTVNLTSSHPRPTLLGNLVSTNQQQPQQRLMSFDKSEKDYRSDTDRTTSSVSENTADTMLTTSPSESGLTPTGGFVCKNKTSNCGTAGLPFQSRFSVPLQPHQGRNPCMERNLMEPDQEVSVRGNTLLGKGTSLKNCDFPFLLDDQVFEGLHFPESIESNVLMSNDALNHTTRICNPIPYVQNAVHSAGAMPKQPNLPGNGHHGAQGNSKNEKKKSFPFFDRKKNNKDKGFKLGLKNLLDRKKTPKNAGPVAEDQQLLQSSPVSEKTNSPLQEGTLYCRARSPKTNLYCSDWYQKLSPVVTRVSIVPGGESDSALSTRETIVKPISVGEGPGPREGTGLDYFHKDDRDINDNCNGSLKWKCTRPDTLPVEAPPLPSNCAPHNQSEKITKRVKTPFQLKKGRFSLCDDRVMSKEEVMGGGMQGDSALTGGQPASSASASSAKVSLSLPMDMNALCASDSDQQSAPGGPTQI